MTVSFVRRGAILIFEQSWYLSRRRSVSSVFSCVRLKFRGVLALKNVNIMSSKENNEVAVEKIDNEKGLEGKCELKGTKRAAEVIKLF